MQWSRIIAENPGLDLNLATANHPAATLRLPNHQNGGSWYSPKDVFREMR